MSARSTAWAATVLALAIVVTIAAPVAAARRKPPRAPESFDNVSQVWYTLLVDGSPYGADLIGYRAATVLRLSPATTYVFKVSVRDAYGNTAQSNSCP